ncbi:putative magnesium-dependent phosphatase P8B7.31 [Diplonema papillatum]|nr:putative magnesium-dependent phosphatase P8B7.31 [Diplonema papillatum]|eukprot:gene23047-35316_t
MAKIAPRMVVFDLDACLWDPEVYVLDGMPSTPIRGDLGDGTTGVVGASDGRQAVRLHPGSLVALRELRKDPGVVVAAASTSLVPKYSYEALRLLEVEPGVSAISCFDHLQIGRSGKLTTRKTSHFKLLHEATGIPYTEMLFFDDCNWEDHVSDLRQTLGVVGRATPRGLSVEDYRHGLDLYHRVQCGEESGSKKKKKR